MEQVTGYGLTGQLREAVARGCGVLDGCTIDWRKNPGALSQRDLTLVFNEILDIFHRARVAIEHTEVAVQS